MSSSARTHQDPKGQQARSRVTRQRLLRAALRLLSEGGPGAVTHRAVADAAEVSVGATTYHFATKSELLAEAYRVHLEGLQTRAEGLADRLRPEEGASAGRRKAQLVEGLLAYLEAGVREDRAGSLATFELALERARDPGLRRRLRPAQAASDAYAVEMLRAFGSAAPELDAPLVIAALSGLRLQWLAAGERSSFAQRIPQLVDRLATRLLPAD